jgi:type IV secretory pathway VirB2 component (pilin)
MSVIAAIVIQPSLSDASPASVLVPATNWVMDLIFGPLATTICIIAIAWVGFAMLSGRIVIRRGVGVILGCFLLLGAKGIAEGLRGSATGPDIASQVTAPPPPVYAKAAPTNNANAYDPYAGAAVMPSR